MSEGQHDWQWETGDLDLERPIQPMPEFVRQALIEHDLTRAYSARPPYQQNDYMWWINDAKRQSTKERRLKQMLDELRQGHGYMNMKWRPQDRHPR